LVMNVYQRIYVYISTARFGQIEGKGALFLRKCIHKLAYYLKELLAVIKILKLPNIRHIIMKYETIIYLFRIKDNLLIQVHVYTY
jgi:hypothetical protein